MKQKMLEIVESRVDMPGVVADLLDEILEPALDDLVKDTDTPLDDVAKNALYPALAPVLKEKAKEYWAKVDGE